MNFVWVNNSKPKGMKKRIYLVGGAVRDRLLNIPNADKDYLAVGYTKEEFSHLECVGKDFPVFLLENGNELALARIERKIASGYNGFSVETKDVSLTDDLKRRDLTINSIAYDEQSDEYFDPYAGKLDIQNKILRHTSLAFSEDPLRVLRLARFQAKFGMEWNIAKETKELVSSMKNELSSLTKERVYKEIDKVLFYDNWFLFFETLFKLDVLDRVFPPIDRLFHTLEIESLKKTSLDFNILSKQNRFYKLVLVYMYDKDIQIELPKKIKKNIFLFVDALKNIHNFEQLSSEKQVKFFHDFKKDEELFFLFLKLVKVFKIEINQDLFHTIFNEIKHYSPSHWIEKQKRNVSGEDIKVHIQNISKNIILKYLLKY